MKYYLDCEFDGFGGQLLSLALVREDLESLYLVYPQPAKYKDQWVEENVAPILWDIPSPMPGMAYKVKTRLEAGVKIANFLSPDYFNQGISETPHIIADWPEDIAYFCQSLLIRPGYMAPIDTFTTELKRIDAYPSKLEDAVRHNAYWDAKALLWKDLHD